MEALVETDRERVIIIGAGHNGLIAAFYLAKAGYAPLVLERSNTVGGSAVTEEIHPGYRCPALFDMTGPLLPQIVNDLQLAQKGLETIESKIQLLALHPNGSPLRIYEDAEVTARELAQLSSHDAAKFPEFHATLAKFGKAIAPLLAVSPPDIDNPTMRDFLNLGKFGLKFRGLHKKDAYRLLRWGPMAIADLAAEWFETELLRAAIEARGTFGTFAGPWSAGTTVGLLMQAALGSPARIRGGIGLLTQTLAKLASAAGAEVRTANAVRRILIQQGRAHGVALDGGEEINAHAVISNADPQHTFLRLVDPSELDPGFLTKIRSYRTMGSTAKVNLALSGPPPFSDGDQVAQIHIGPDTDYLERAYDASKYGDFSAEPVLSMTVPSLADPSLAPQPGHVMSIFVQYAPYRLRMGTWDSRREEFGDVVVKTLSRHAPGIEKLILQRQILTPLDLERRFGLTGGHLFHGEHALDQLFAFRPVLGWARYRTPIKGLYLCGSGTHPGGGITGAPGLNASRVFIATD
jgi:phytoene dehydrogenase-like protein